MRALAYIRRSKDPVDGNASLVDQREWIMAESARRGHHLARHDIFEEVVSAYRDRSRPQRDLLEKTLTAGDVVALYVRDLDRLARRMLDTARIVDICNRHHVTIYTHERTFTPGSPDTILLVSILGGLAETEAATISKRLKRTAENIRLKGGWNGSAPYGWVLPAERNADGVKTLKLHPQESIVVRKIVDWRLEGLSVAEIVRKLREEHITNRTGEPFQYRAVSAILRHPVLAGYTSLTAKARGHEHSSGSDLRNTREIVIGRDGKPVRTHEAICTPQEWETLRLLMIPRKHSRTRARAGSLMLVGLMFCSICGMKMTSNRSLGETGVYICNGRMKGRDCPGMAISAASTEAYICKIVAGCLDNALLGEDQHRVIDSITADSVDPELTALQEEAEQLRQSLQTLQQQVRSAPAVAVSTLLDRIREEDIRLAQIDQQIAGRIDARPREIPRVGGQEFLALDDEQKKPFIRTFIRRIIIHPDDGNKGSVKGMFGSQGVNLHRIAVALLGDDESNPPRRGAGYSLMPADGQHRCPHCTEPRIFRYRNNLLHHMKYAHPKPIPCPECKQPFPLPGMPSHRRAKHGVMGKNHRSAD